MTSPLSDLAAEVKPADLRKRTIETSRRLRARRLALLCGVVVAVVLLAVGVGYALT